MKFNFDIDKLNYWFCGEYVCWWCGKWHANCYHHIFGRTSSSILNAAPLNNHECHLPHHPFLKKPENQKMFLRKTLEFLLKRGYEFTEEDKRFIEEYYNYYVEILDELQKEKNV